jgi:hypothetical protein
MAGNVQHRMLNLIYEETNVSIDPQLRAHSPYSKLRRLAIGQYVSDYHAIFNKTIPCAHNKYPIYTRVIIFIREMHR